MLAPVFLLYFFVYLDQSLSASPKGDVVEELTVGYQGWFSCSGDNSPRGSWFHWSNGGTPAPGNLKFEIWPDMSEYENTYQTDFANLGNGGQARLFSSWDDQTIDTHFRWMAENGIKTVALQRFAVSASNPQETQHVNGIADKVFNAAAKYGQKVYIMYDISGWNAFQQEIKDDFPTLQRWLDSPVYAKQNGKAVVCVWGIGFDDRPGDQASLLDIISFFRGRNLYVIGGVPRQWRTGESSKPGFKGVYDALDMVSPWTVGAFGNVADAHAYQTTLRDDYQDCESRGKDFQPVVFPGFAWSNWYPGDTIRNQIPRAGGSLMWQEFVNLRELGSKNVYVAMFDEFDEGTAIAKAATSKDLTPTNQYFLTLDEDGVQMSSDFYLRLTKDGGDMVKGLTPLRQNHTTPYF